MMQSKIEGRSWSLPAACVGVFRLEISGLSLDRHVVVYCFVEKRDA